VQQKIHELVYELKVADVMTTELISVHPKALMSDLREILRTNKISGLPVVDDGALVGIISLEDFIRALADGEVSRPIEEKMSKNVETLYDDEPLTSAIHKFDHSGMGRFPAIERDGGKLVGILTKGDVIKGLLKKFEVDYHQEEIHRYRASHIFEDIEADDTRLTFQYKVAGKDFKRAGEGSSRLKRTLTRLGIRPEIVRRLAIASYEAEMNLVIFADGGTIAVQVEPSRVLVEVEDSGPGIEDIEKAMQPGYSTAADWVRELGFGAGMGLQNIKRMSDEFEIDSERGRGTLLKLSFLTGGNHHEAC
jgi:CBS domain-containing protein/anti-sigma regulatory factor (Ser/Thr protein kinase)